MKKTGNFNGRIEALREREGQLRLAIQTDGFYK